MLAWPGKVGSFYQHTLIKWCQLIKLKKKKDIVLNPRVESHKGHTLKLEIINTNCT